MDLLYLKPPSSGRSGRSWRRSEPPLYIPSAPGKRDKNDYKITDLLYKCQTLAQEQRPFGDVFEVIKDRYRSICDELGLSLELESEFATIARTIAAGVPADYAASRGEYLNGIILAAYLNFPFLDPATLIFFDQQGHFDGEKTQSVLNRELAHYHQAVIPGFYGSTPAGQIQTFSRGGSDITGAIVAKGVQADLYENWTDVSGFLMADPRIVRNPKPIREITTAN